MVIKLQKSIEFQLIHHNIPQLSSRFEAAFNGHSEVCHLILDNVQDKNPRTHDGWTPLHSAINGNNLEVFELLFDNVEDKNPMNDGCWSPFHLAARFGRIEICRFIVDNLEDKNPCQRVRWNQYTPLDFAIRNGHQNIANYIKSKLVN